MELTNGTEAGSGRLGSWVTAKDGGYTSIGIVVALTLVLTLAFTSMQVNWLNSRAGDIQFVADSGALAAQNVVADYVIATRLADAVVLSLSLLGLSIVGIAIVVSCIPLCQEAGAALMNLGNRVFTVRDNCARQAAAALDKLQKALPFLCVVNAASAVSANATTPGQEQRYVGLAIPVPLKGEGIGFADIDAVRTATAEVGRQNAQTAELSDAAQEAYDDMQESKLAGYMADCGNAPNYCMYQRAAKLAEMNGGSNPWFSSPDTWLFDYAFERARSYYSVRLANEKPANGSLEENVRSAARRQYYAYAVEEMRKGYARTAADGTLDAYFPLLAYTADEVRKTRLYTMAVWPACSLGMLHGHRACPAYSANGGAGSGSLAQLEAGRYNSCETCDFKVTTVSSVPRASTVNSSGFEYHYRIVAKAAEDYMHKQKEYAGHEAEARKSAEQAFDSYEDALDALQVQRFNPRPPGRFGCIAIVVDLSTHTAPAAVRSPLLASDAVLGPRIAISAATMAEDKADKGSSIITALLDKAIADGWASGGGDWALQAFKGVLNIWADALMAYDGGITSLTKGVGDFLRSVSPGGSTALARWAEDTLTGLLDGLGLQPAELSTPKPVVVNTLHVMKAGDNSGLRALEQAKSLYSALPGSGSGSLGGEVAGGLIQEARMQGSAALEQEFTLFTIDFAGYPGAPQVPVQVSLPDAVVQRGQGLLDGMAASLQGLIGGGNNAVWE